MNLRGDLSKEFTLKVREQFQSRLRNWRREELLNKRRIEIEEDNQRVHASLIQKETLKELFDQLKHSLSDQILKEKLIFIKHQIKRSIDLNGSEKIDFIKFYLNLINHKDTSISTIVLLTLSDLVSISEEYSFVIDNLNGIEILCQNTNEKQLILPILTLIGNMVVDDIQKAKEITPFLIQQAIIINELHVLRTAAWVICNCSGVKGNVNQFLSSFLFLQDNEIRKQVLMACVSCSQNNTFIPFDQIINFITDDELREYVIEILANESYWNNFLPQIYSILSPLMLTKLQPKEITNVIWMIENISVNSVDYLIKLGEIGCIDFVIKQSSSNDISIKRECCQALNTFIVVSQNDLTILKVLVERKIVICLINLIKQYQLLEKNDIILLIDALIVLMKSDSIEMGVGLVIEENVRFLEIVLFDSKTPTKICKKIQWLIDTYFE